MEQFARELFRVERTISLVDDDSSGKPKIRREEGTEAKMVREIADVLVECHYQLHYSNVFFFASLNPLQNRQIQSKIEIRKERSIRKERFMLV